MTRLKKERKLNKGHIPLPNNDINNSSRYDNHFAYLLLADLF